MQQKQESQAESGAQQKQKTPMTLSKAFGQIGLLTAISRVFGFVRDLVFAHILGAGPATDAFLIAFKLPNLFRRLTADGAMTNAFLPAFSHLRKQAGRSAALMFAAEIQIILLLVLSVIVILAEIFMPFVIGFLAPGFIDTPDRFEAAVALARISIPYLPMISLVALWAAITNAHDRFFGGAASPIILNLGLIGGALCVPLFASTNAKLLAENPLMLSLPIGVAILLAGVAQMLFLQAAMGRISARPRLIRPTVSPQGKKMWSAFLPAALGAGGLQLNLLVDTILASLLAAGSVSWLYYGDRVAQLPLGIIGIALGTALLPRLSQLEADGRQADIPAEISKAAKLAAFFSLPCAVASVMMAEPIIAGLFGGGAFSNADILAAAGALAAYGIGIPAFVFAKIFQPAFFAAGQAKLMLRISLSAVVINIAASLYLMQIFAHIGLALATSLAAYTVLGIQAFLLARANKLDSASFTALIRPAIASLIMGAVIAIILTVDSVPQDWPASDVITMGLLIGTGGGSYLIACWLFGCLPVEILGGRKAAGAKNT